MDSIYSDFKLNFLFAEKYNFTGKWTYPIDLIPYCIYRFILSGRAIFKVNDVSYEVKKNDVFYIPQGCKLECRALEAISFISVRFVGPVALQGVDVLKDLFGIPYLYHSENSKIRDHFEEIYLSSISKQKNKMFKIRGLLYLITAELTEDTASDTEFEENYKAIAQRSMDASLIKNRSQWAGLHNDARITVLVDYMITHPSEKLSVGDMCNMLEMSESSLRRLFKNQTGKSPKEFIHEMKMVTAARRILVRNERISEIAYELGFESANYFARCFKKVYGMPPYEYRKQSHGL